MIKFLKFLRGFLGVLSFIGLVVTVVSGVVYEVTDTIGVFFNDTVREILFKSDDICLIAAPIWIISTILYYLLDKRLP